MAAAHLAAPDRPLSLDKIARSGMAADSVQGPAAKGASTQGADADENFTGSAYFYAEDAFARNLPADAKFGFLPKPFSLKQLATVVKEVLEAD